MKRYNLQQCDGYDAECNAEMMETSLGDYVDAVEAINTISRLRSKIKIMSKCLERIRTEENIHQYQWMPVLAGDALHEAAAINFTEEV